MEPTVRGIKLQKLLNRLKYLQFRTRFHPKQDDNIYLDEDGSFLVQHLIADRKMRCPIDNYEFCGTMLEVQNIKSGAKFVIYESDYHMMAAHDHFQKMLITYWMS